MVEDLPGAPSSQSWIAGAVLGSWVFLVLVLAAVIVTIIWVNIKLYKRRENYEQLANNNAVNNVT
ncbi:hypothetical protein GBAR_LOCUS2199 [Geodia barretti]|uniref:Uncharacterized protein n=1 Tax=Geodia barretti TaxID=519541 RepID=A0AA35QYY2_GEOBA|nr:hypothetical protein GBAR_LOCUS2199 [Geodia barretti]